MANYDYDLFVIGGGSGGVRAARMAAASGMKVGIAESGSWGGTCVNLGCVPKKFFVYASEFSDQFEVAQSYGWSVDNPTFDWPTLIANKNTQISRLNGIYLTLLGNNGVDMFEARAEITSSNEVLVEGKKLSAAKILIATGGKPSVPDISGREHVITSDQVFHLEKFPARVVIVGGGYIACEFATIFNGLGANVTQLYRGDLPLRGFDLECREFLVNEVRQNGLDLRVNTDVSSIAKNSDGSLVVKLNNGSEVECDQVMYATGRAPLTEALWHSDVGIKTGNKGEILVDNNFQTSVDSIFAIGDVINRVALTPVAIEEAMHLVEYWKSGEKVSLDYAKIPSAIFTSPSLATVGVTEEEVISTGARARVYTSSVRALKNTLTPKKDRVLLKLIVDTRTDKVIGAHMVGDDAADVIQGIAIAVGMGATKADFDATVGLHPSAAEEFVTMYQAET